MRDNGEREGECECGATYPVIPYSNLSAQFTLSVVRIFAMMTRWNYRRKDQQIMDGKGTIAENACVYIGESFDFIWGSFTFI